MPEWKGLDFETYGATSLPDYGLDRYTSCKTFRPLIASVTSLNPNTGYRRDRFDLVTGGYSVEDVMDHIGDAIIVAHNAPFEQRVLASQGIRVPSKRFIDSAVWARAWGAGSKLEAAAPQLLGMDKLEMGKDLIKLFSIPGKYQEQNGNGFFDPAIIEEYPTEWANFGHYCDVDSELGLRIALKVDGYIPIKEQAYNAVTMDMNATGWPVDIASVEEMQRRYLENVEATVEAFRAKHGAADLNLNSLKQLKEWCAERGIKANSFDEANVQKLLVRINKRMASMVLNTDADHEKYQGYDQVCDLLETKQVLGGSSLKKLQTILDLTGEDGRLRDQYLHIGAGQSWRTSGKGVQMQNLKRLSTVADMSTLDDLESDWDNDKLAENIRQVFKAEHEEGEIIVGDFSSVESRGLAWLAGATWKLDAYRQGKDMYKVLASSPDMFNVPYDQVTPEQRQAGKVGELSCGYQAGGGAVQAFAEKMGVHLTEGEATQLVGNWRRANPEIVFMWAELDDALNEAYDAQTVQVVRVGPNAEWKVSVYRTETPASLLAQHPGAQSMCVDVLTSDGAVWLSRVFHGVYRRGNSLCYYKPSELKSGDLWKSHYTDPKTKQVRFFSIYGGKLAGILTQSFCREMFFASLQTVHTWAESVANVRLIGQFHDEIVLEWWPDGDSLITVPLQRALEVLEHLMSDTIVPGFPLAAEVKHGHRYIK